MKRFEDEIAAVTNRTELIADEKKIFATKQTKRRRSDVLKACRAKRLALDWTLLAETKNKLFKQCMYFVNTMSKRDVVSIINTGKMIRGMTDSNKFSRSEADLLLRSFAYQKNKLTSDRTPDLFPMTA